MNPLTDSRGIPQCSPTSFQLVGYPNESDKLPACRTYPLARRSRLTPSSARPRRGLAAQPRVAVLGYPGKRAVLRPNPNGVVRTRACSASATRRNMLREWLS